MSTLSERLYSIIDGASVRSFCLKNSLSVPAFHNYLKARGNGRSDSASEPTLSNSLKIAAAAGVSLDWLAGREGATREYSRDAATTVAEDFVEVREYDIQLSAGHGVYPEEHQLSIGSRTFRANWLREKGLSPADLYLVRVHGDSMEPLIRDKDMIMVDVGRTRPSEAAPFAVMIDDVLYVKFVQKISPSVLRLISVNPIYTPIEVDLPEETEHFRIIGAVVWHAHSWI